MDSHFPLIPWSGLCDPSMEITEISVHPRERCGLYLSSLFIVFLTMSGFSLNLFELACDIISILFLIGSLKASSAGQLSNRIRSICPFTVRSMELLGG